MLIYSIICSALSLYGTVLPSQLFSLFQCNNEWNYCWLKKKFHLSFLNFQPKLIKRMRWNNLSINTEWMISLIFKGAPWKESLRLKWVRKESGGHFFRSRMAPYLASVNQNILNISALCPCYQSCAHAQNQLLPDC